MDALAIHKATVGYGRTEALGKETAPDRAGLLSTLLSLLSLDDDSKDTEFRVFETILEFEAQFTEGIPQIFAIKTILRGMKEETPGDDVQVEGRIELLDKIDPSLLQYPRDLGSGFAPVVGMMKDTETENGTELLIAKGKLMDVSNTER